jgi:tetratricopeptide (TPR) repeat protein
MLEVTLFVSIGWIISICLHEFGHAILAYWGGDTSVKEKGYLTLNPFQYSEPGYSLILPLLFLMMGGVGLPGTAIYINRQNLSSRWRQSAVAAAGPVASILTVLLLVGIFRLATPVFWVQPALAFLIWLQVWGILINLLPIPSLDGFGIIEPFLARRIRSFVKPFYQYGFFGILLLLWIVKPFGNFFQRAATTISQQALGIPVATAMEGYQLFKPWSLPVILGIIVVFAISRRFIHSPAETLLEKSEKLIKQQRYAEAVALLNKDLTQNPQNFDAWWLKGTALCHLNCYNDALDCYQVALKINPGVASLWQNSALLLSAMDRPEQAIDMYNRALEIDPDDVQLWISKAILWAELGRFPKALATIDRAVEVNPRSVDAWYQRACYESHLRDYESALMSLKQAIQLNPTVRNSARHDSNFINLRNNLAFHQLTRAD